MQKATERVLMCTTTALACILLQGTTVHYVCEWVGVDYTCNLQSDSERWNRLRDATTIILDEMSMLTQQ